MIGSDTINEAKAPSSSLKEDNESFCFETKGNQEVTRSTQSPLSFFRQALARGARLLSGKEPEKARLFKKGIKVLDRSASIRLARFFSILFTFIFLLGPCAPLFMAIPATAALDSAGSTGTALEFVPNSEDFTLGALSSNLTITVSGTLITVWTEEYAIKVDFSTSFVDYRIQPYFCTDFIRYRRVNPQYAGDGTYDANGNALDSVSMTISSWGRSGNNVWFIESCPEFSLNQSFRVYRDYFELDVTYKPGTKKVLTTYFIGLYSASNSLYSLVNTATGRFNRYIPGYAEDTPDGYGFGGWYPSFKMFAPACDLRVPGKNLGVEWGYNETVAYLYSPVWMKDCGTGGASVMALKFSSKNSVVPNVALGTEETFHMFCRPYKYSDGKQRGYNVGYAQWVAPKIASAWGNHNTPIFPLAVMDLGSWTSTFRSYVENSEIKLATYSKNPNQINWNYKSSQISNTNPGDAANVPYSWQIITSSGAPMLTNDGTKVICNPVSGPYNTPGTYRWQLINNDPYMAWWTGTKGVFWDEMNLWTAENRLKNDYQQRSDFLLDGYLRLVQESYASGYWDYVIANPFTGLLHLSIAADICLLEGYEPSSIYGTDLVKHVHSTMNFVNMIPETYRPRILVYQNYATGNTNDQLDVYSVLFGAAKYGFHVTLLSYDSYDSQLRYLRMAEEMFKAMGCTRDSDVRTVTVDTLDLALSNSITTAAQMLVTKGAGSATITATADLSSFTITNLHATSNTFDLRVPSGSYYIPGPGVTKLSDMTYSADGYAKFSGRIDPEKTSKLNRVDDIKVYQRLTGSATISLSSLGPNADLTVSSTGGSTEIILRGYAPGKSYDIFVNSVKVDTKIAAQDGSISFTRSYGSNDRVTTSLSTAADVYPPHVVSCSPSPGATSVSITTKIRIVFNESMDINSAQSAFSLSGTSNVAGSFIWEDENRVVTFSPSTTLSYATTYTVQISVAARDVAGNALSSSYISTFTTEAQPTLIVVPSAPLSLMASGGVKCAFLSWSPPANDGGASLSGYKLYRAINTGDAGYAPVATLGNVNSYTDVGLSDGTVYYYKVSATNSAGEGALSAEVSCVTFALPSEPLSLSGVGGVRSVTLSWSPPASDGGTPITGYRLYRGTSTTSQSLIATLGPVLSFVDASLSNGTTYYYRVSAVNAVGEGGSSPIASTTTSVLVPSAPRGLIASASKDSITLTWTAPTSDGGSKVTGYRIYRGASSENLALIASISNDTYYMDSGLVNGQIYYYRVSAINVAGEGSLSEVVAAATSAQVPSAPLSLIALAGDGCATLSWSSPLVSGGSPLLGYRLYRAVGTGSMSLIRVLEDVYFMDSNLTNGQIYRYTVTALNSAGESEPSNEVSVLPVGPPSQPLELQAIPGNSVCTLSWSIPENDGGAAIIGYRIYRGLSPNSLSMVATVGQALTFVDEGLTNGQQVYYAVAAVNEVGVGALSPQVTCVPGFVPSSPRSLTAIGADSKVELSWSAPLFDNGFSIEGYVVYRGTSPDELIPYASLGNVLQFTDSSVINGVEYHYRITARNAKGESGFSPLASARPATVPSSPQLLFASAGLGTISLSWQPPLTDGGDSIIGYVIFRGSTADELVQIAMVTSSSYQDSGLGPGIMFYYEVRAFNGQGLGAGTKAWARTYDLPSTPLNLQAVADKDKIALSWSVPNYNGGTAVLNYKIYRGAAPGNLICVALTNETYYLDTGLTPGIEYYYAVSAVNAVGEGMRCEVASARLPASVPSSPTWIEATTSGAMISLRWAAPTSDGGSIIVSYRLYRGQGSEPMMWLTDVNTPSYIDGQVSPGISYSYKVSALNAVGEGPASPEVKVQLLLPPSPPGNLVATKGKNSVMLTWEKPEQDGGSERITYVVYRGTSPSQLTKLTTVSSGLSFTDTALPKSDFVYYRVSSLNAVGESALSNLASVSLSKKPAPPKGLTVTAQDGKVLLSWQSPEYDVGEEVLGYTIYRQSSGEEMTMIASTNGTSYLDEGLINGRYYTYAVATITPMGIGEALEGPPVKPYGLPDPPLSLTYVPYDGMVVLKWDAPDYDGGADIEAYNIYLKSKSGTILIGQVTGLMNSFAVHDVPDDEQVNFMVTAVNAAGESSAAIVQAMPKSALDVKTGISDGVILGASLPVLLGAVALAGAALGAGTWGWHRGQTGTARKKPLQKSSVSPAEVVKMVHVRRPQSQNITKRASTPTQNMDLLSFERTLKDLEVTERIW
ncbi:MAG: fibronectin type III domain-containing protein [Methanomassiliicoccales archaeon]